MNVIGGQPYNRIILDEGIDMPRNCFLDIDYGLSVLLASLLDLSFEFIEVLERISIISQRQWWLISTAPPVSRMELTNLKKRSQPAEMAIELEKLCLRVSAAALTASISSNIVETISIVSQSVRGIGGRLVG